MIDPNDEGDNLPENVPISLTDESYDAQRILENMYPPSDDKTSGQQMAGIEEVQEESGTDN